MYWYPQKTTYLQYILQRQYILYVLGPKTKVHALTFAGTTVTSIPLQVLVSTPTQVWTLGAPTYIDIRKGDQGTRDGDGVR
jgi:hypothetical protein